MITRFPPPRRATIYLMQRPAADIVHVFRKPTAASICGHVAAGGPLLIAQDGIVTCTSCIDTCTLEELAALVLMEQREGRPRSAYGTRETAALNLIAAGSADLAAVQGALYLPDGETEEELLREAAELAAHRTIF